MAKIKIQTGLRLDEDIYLKLKSLSETERRSINNLVEFIVEKYIAEYEQANGSIQVAQDS